MNESIISRNDYDHNLAAIFPRTKPGGIIVREHCAGAQIAINLANASAFHAQLATVLRTGFHVIIINAWKAQLNRIYAATRFAPRGWNGEKSLSGRRSVRAYSITVGPFRNYYRWSRTGAQYRVDIRYDNVGTCFQGEIGAYKVAGIHDRGIPAPSLEETFVKEVLFPAVRSDSTMGLQCRYIASWRCKLRALMAF